MVRRVSALPALAALLMLAAVSVSGQTSDAPATTDIEARAEQGQAEAQFALGQRHHTGDGVMQDYAEAAHWFELAAAQGHPDAANLLARYRFEGLGVEQDRAEALRLFEAAAETGDPDHVFDLARALEASGADMERVATLYQQAADAGNADAAVSLGVLYQEGIGVEQNFARARELYEQPADQGNARALNNLGLLYVRGDGVPQDYARAAEYFSAAVDLGLSTAMTNLGVLYENGFGVELDEERARALYRAGGRKEDVGSGDNAGLIYDSRLKPLDSTDEALQALKQSAEAGDPVALFQLGWVLLQQPDAPFQAQFQAAALFRVSAEAGYGPAMANLGSLYFQGRGVPQDFVLGHMWILRAGHAGTPDTPALAEGYLDKMTPGQITEAQSLAKSGP
ncbi:hypothetical protein BOO69_00680 [Sulfitobacter alexandrii]|uniref:Sel1 repeat family protein n=1 Tax=Sulfitobacter alexandrii TaxID=1917485 RepID=A0A1J0WCN5_9RHOB|nr:tetratricopeptide repeat protein [Sulfitobacter alexandrii]APE42087.1 hypothetical protein BOO69_00680 [Sulfitobacter alexandrii]